MGEGMDTKFVCHIIVGNGGKLKTAVESIFPIMIPLHLQYMSLLFN